MKYSEKALNPRADDDSSRRPHWVVLSAKNKTLKLQFTLTHKKWSIED